MNLRKSTVATLVAALTAAPLCAYSAQFAERLPSVPTAEVVRPLSLVGASLALPAMPALPTALPAAGANLSALPGVSLVTLPAAAIPAGPAIPLELVRPARAVTVAASAAGPKALTTDLGRVQKAMAAMPDAAKGGAGASRQSGEDLEKAMTGEGARQDAAPAVPANEDSAAKKEAVMQAKSTIENILAEVSKVIVGQDEMKRAIIMAMIARQHVLLEGLPGVAKTETAKAFADAVEGSFQRVQGTPDKLPSDILGSEILQENPETGKKSFELTKGPIFTNILLMDEINRMPPKAQAALLEAMAEGRVTIGRQTLPLNRFTVIATQNPVEQDGTYRLPEAQLDRFMFKVLVPQPTAEDLKHVMRINRYKDAKPKAGKVTTLAQLDEMRRLAETLTIGEDVEDYIVRVAMAASQKDLKGTVEYTVYTRASIYLEQAARIHALMRGSTFVTPTDVRAVAPLVLRHRIALSYQAQGQTVEELIQTILDRTAVGRPGKAS